MHLDSPFSTVPVSRGERLREELREVFREIMKTAGECFDAVLISGDLFDCGFISPDTVELVRGCFAAYGRPVVIAPGNHDPYVTGSVWAVTDWPENVRIFSSSALSSFELEIAGEPATVWGWAFTAERMDACPEGIGEEKAPGRIHLLCAHADTQSPVSRYCPLPGAVLARSGCVYAALGHIHNPPEPRKYGATLTAYCGFPEGRSFDETGIGAVMAVVAGQNEAGCERLPTGRHRYEIMEADISGCRDDDGAARILCAELEKAGINESWILRAELTGTVSPRYMPDVTAIGSEVGLLLPEHERPMALQVRDHTAPVLDADYLSRDLTIRGELYRTLLPSLISEDEQVRSRAAAALRIGLRALDGKSLFPNAAPGKP